ncbi:hypothetical protein ES703_44689 [subsurface metagenome]
MKIGKSNILAIGILIFSILFSSCATDPWKIKGDRLSIKITQNYIRNGHKGIRFEILDVRYKILYKKSVFFRFKIKQGSETIAIYNSDVFKVPYDYGYWTKAGSFFFTYKTLNSKGNSSEKYKGCLYILEIDRSEDLPVVIRIKCIDFYINE